MDTQSVASVADTPTQATSAPEAQNSQQANAESSSSSQQTQETSEQRMRRLHDQAYAKATGNSAKSGDEKSAQADEPEPGETEQGAESKQVNDGKQNGVQKQAKETPPAEQSDGPSIDECRRALLRAKFSTERIAKMSEPEIREFGSVFKASQAEQDALGAKLGRQRNQAQEQQQTTTEAANSATNGGQQSTPANGQARDVAPQQSSQGTQATTPIVDVNAFKDKIERVRAEAGEGVADLMQEMLNAVNTIGGERVKQSEQAVAQMQQEIGQYRMRAAQERVETSVKSHLANEFPQVKDQKQFGELMSDLAAVVSARGPISDAEVLELAQQVAGLRWSDQQRNLQQRLITNASRQNKGTPKNADGKSPAIENKKLTPKQLSDKAVELANQGKSPDEVRNALRRYQ